MSFTQWPICELNKTLISFPYSSCVSYRKYRSVAISHNFIKLVCYWSMVDLWKHIARQFCQCSKLFRMVFSYISVVLICLFSFKKKEFFATNLFRMILFYFLEIILLFILHRQLFDHYMPFHLYIHYIPPDITEILLNIVC